MSNNTFINHHFVYGRPVRSSEFLNRKPELATVFNRLYHGESTAVVGAPHIGKTSLLLQLANKETQRAFLGSEARTQEVSFADLQHIASEYAPALFWEKALEPLREHPRNSATSRLLKEVVLAGYSADSLDQLFDYLYGQKRRLVLLLDEFDVLVSRQDFCDFSFFATLRTLSSYPSFSLVTASRLSLKELNEQGYKLPGSGGSPLFNTLIELRLRPFKEKTVNALLARAGGSLSSGDRLFVRRVAGRNPFLLQAMAATMLETAGNDRHTRAAECFYERISSHFDDLWRTLDDRTRTTAVILSLMELGGRAIGQDFAYGEIERVDAFGPELKKLAKLGLAERVSKGWQFDRERLLLWRGERWTVGSQAFTWWVSDVVIAETRKTSAYDEWLMNKRYRFLLTQEQWDRLVGAVRKAPEWVVRGVGALAHALLEEMASRKQV